MESVYTVDDAHVYTFMLDGLYPNRRYCFKPDNYGPEFTVDLINLTPGTKYYFLVALGDVKMEISSFTTASN